MGQVLVSGIILGALYALVSLGLTLIFGVIKVVNFAHGSLLMIGMYVCYYIIELFHINVYASLLIVIPFMFIVGVFIQKLMITRLLDHPNMQLFATFGLLNLLASGMLSITKGQVLNVSVDSAVWGMGRISVPSTQLLIPIALIVTATGLYLFLHRTRLGTAVRGISQNRYAAELIGINVQRLYMMTFGLGTACVGVASVMCVPLYSIFPQIGESFIYVAFAVVILGGLGSIRGAVLSGLIIGLTESVSGYVLAPDLKQLIWYVVFLGVLLIRPYGLFGVPGAEEVGLK